MSRFLRPKYNKLGDENLIELFKQRRDEAALNCLIKRYMSKVYYFSLSILKNQMDAEDAAMEVWANLKNHLVRYQIDNFSAWLMKVTKTESLKVLKSRMKNRFEELSEKNDPALMEFPLFEALDDRNPELEKLSKAVDELKEEQNRCIVAFYFQGMSYEEIAEEEGFELSKVKSHLQNGKRNLRLQLTK
ncbi:RNA polymerase sigma factor [Phaeodactylibacter xiamenensis]|jgi:RNA polymerase sigma-70 factor (ECF subfamily)|uniref:RNA polymerase subunit sigma-24 n=1 Tax=Phaeodactylibacter xiamenensis TaxID=1524460 RepID=A0A098S347_9BACT|nr:sigma-70 family RNA polymerase sigma factor [Phaeodactylibacter xiamenensis]KGE86228.1 hypothetical protein IX84_22665 [Phaeodactylibacter xiamenensis]MCR9052064.1 sigma-70 family RNA polymerase sigma factor [bacterium]